MAEIVSTHEATGHKYSAVQDPYSGLYGPRDNADKIDGHLTQGARLVGSGAIFGVRASLETSHIDVCLQNPRELSETVQRFRLPEVGYTNDGGKLFGGYIRGVKNGHAYGFRVTGTYDPPYHLQDYNTLLVDPYANQFVFHARPGNKYEPFSTRPISIVADTSYDWRGDKSPNIDPAQRVIYEAHVKGLTQLHPGIPQNLRGTYAGAAHPVVLRHLKELGVTTVEFLPVQQSVSESLTQPGRLPNYWGYNTLGPFAPNIDYSFDKQNPNREFKNMVRAYHAAGIEVSLDVVPNHTGEGGADGPIYSFKGLDNAGMYRLNHGNYQDYSGCGNTFDTSRPAARNVVLDSLRYWVRDMHIDRYRVDLFTAVIRDGFGAVDLNHPFFEEVRRDQVLKKVDIDVEPWDATYGSNILHRIKWVKHYRGWNDDFRNNTRSFWNRRGLDINDLAHGLSGTESPEGVINIVTTHDGFTMRDVVTYDTKKNDANGEKNRDGDDNNRSWNHGKEGEEVNLRIRESRLRTACNMFGTLLLADGTPMILAGDEMWRTQEGNNNAYCQDNETSWLPWKWDDEAQLIFQMAKAFTRVRKDNDRAGVAAWLNVWGGRMRTDEWHNGTNVLGMYRGARRLGRDIIYYVNRMDKMMEVSLPTESGLGGKFEQLINTGTMKITMDRPIPVPPVFQMEPNSSLVVRRRR